MHLSTVTRLGRCVRVGASLPVAVILLSACASAPPAPTASLAAARQAIASAEQSDARQYADGELDEARQRLLMAERAVNSENMIVAERYARQSRITAELASVRTESAKAVEINRAMGRGTEALIEDMQRTGDRL